MKYDPCTYCSGDAPCIDCNDTTCIIVSPCECCPDGGENVEPPKFKESKKMIKTKFKEKSRTTDDRF